VSRLEAAYTQEEKDVGYEGDVNIDGESPGIGNFKIVVTGAESNKHPIHGHPSGMDKALDKTFVYSSLLPEEALWQAKPVLFALMKDQIDDYIEKYTQDNMPPPFQLYTIKNNPGVGNVQVIQKIFEGPFQFDVLFSSKDALKEMTSLDLTSGIESATATFEKRFRKIFKPQAPYSMKKYIPFSESLLSNLLGGIGYFYGDWKVDRSYAPEYEEENEGFWEETAEARERAEIDIEGPSELFSSIPSRPFFPRGFLWDEGFHLMPIMDWDLDLTLEIVKSWFNLIDDEGWIAREQILGPEARSKVPPEFQVQYPHYANPPTLFFILSDFVTKLQESASFRADSDDRSFPGLKDETAAAQYLRELYPLLRRHYLWFRRTQQGDLKSYDRNAFSAKEGYRWRGRSPAHILPSGLDDYPRAQPPHPGELHVDAISWVGLMTKSLLQIAQYLEEEDDAAEYSNRLEAIRKNIDDLHWDNKAGVFCDATIDEFEENALVCHKGYMSLFPFMVGLLDKNSPKIGKLLDLISDPEELWSPHGIRSLSKSHEMYGTGENYWRSPVWINMNYLILLRLQVSSRCSLTQPDKLLIARRNLHNQARIKSAQQKSILSFVRTWLTQSINRGRRRDLLGSNTIRILVLDKGLNILLDGQVSS
jgi:mannosyl-oligosaccharide glucosidase